MVGNVQKVLESMRKQDIHYMPGEFIITERVEDEYINNQSEKMAKDIISAFKKTSGENILYVEEHKLFVDIVSTDTGSWGTFNLIHNKLPSITINANYDKQCKKWFIQKEFDKIAKKLYRVLQHECIHYINYIISVDSNKWLGQERMGYASKFNNPEEFSAYYHQIRNLLTNIAIKKVKNDTDFDNTFGDTTQKFIHLCWNSIKTINQDMYVEIRNDEVYRRKWMKRLYQLYFELKQKFCNGLVDK